MNKQQTKTRMQLLALEVVKIKDKMKEIQNECEHEWHPAYCGTTDDGGRWVECTICGQRTIT